MVCLMFLMWFTQMQIVGLLCSRWIAGKAVSSLHFFFYSIIEEAVHMLLPSPSSETTEYSVLEASCNL